jgi:hypothetical protein
MQDGKVTITDKQIALYWFAELVEAVVCSRRSARQRDDRVSRRQRDGQAGQCAWHRVELGKADRAG